MRVSAASLTAVSGTGGTRNEANASSISDGAFYAVLTGQARPFREPGVEAGHPCWLRDRSLQRCRCSTATRNACALTRMHSKAVPPVERVDRRGDDRRHRSARLTRCAPIRSFREAALAPLGGTTLLSAPAPAYDQFTVASFNLDRFYDAADDAGADTVLTAAAFDLRLAKASLTIRNVLNIPDVVGVQEVEHLGALLALASRIDSDAAAAGAADAAVRAVPVRRQRRARPRRRLPCEANRRPRHHALGRTDRQGRDVQQSGRWQPAPRQRSSAARAARHGRWVRRPRSRRT